MTTEAARLALENPDSLFQAKLDLLAALRWAEREGLSEGICNHFSVLVPGTTDRFLLNPQGLHWSELTISDLLIVDAAGNLVEGKHEAEPTAFFIHSRIHLSKPSAKCVMHTHMPYATALCCSQRGRVEWCSQNALRYYGRIGYDDCYNGLALVDLACEVQYVNADTLRRGRRLLELARLHQEAFAAAVATAAFRAEAARARVAPD